MSKFYTKNGVFEGEKYDLNCGELHREDGPAIEHANGSKEWWVEGKRHRTDGPAIENANGIKRWYINGLVHRTDGPAIENANGDKQWWVEGQLHREDGPAIERKNGCKEWYIEDYRYSEENFYKEIKRRKSLTTKDKNTEYRDLVWYTVFKNITSKQLLQTAAASTQSLNEIIDKHIVVAKKEGAPLLNDTINVLLDKILNT